MYPIFPGEVLAQIPIQLAIVNTVWRQYHGIIVMKAPESTLLAVLAGLVCVSDSFVAVPSALSSLSSACRLRTHDDFATFQQPFHQEQQSTCRGGRCGARTDMFFGSSSGVMPKLYDGWFKKTGQIQKDIVACTKSVLKCVHLRIVQGVLGGISQTEDFLIPYLSIGTTVRSR